MLCEKIVNYETMFGRCALIEQFFYKINILTFLAKYSLSRHPLPNVFLPAAKPTGQWMQSVGVGVGVLVGVLVLVGQY